MHAQTYISFKNAQQLERVVVGGAGGSGPQAGRKSMNFAIRNSQQRKGTIVGSSSSNVLLQQHHQPEFKIDTTSPGKAKISPKGNGAIALRPSKLPLSGSKAELGIVTKSNPATLVVQGANLLVANNKTPEHVANEATTTCPVHSTMFQPKDRVSNLSKEASKRIKTD